MESDVRQIGTTFPVLTSDMAVVPVPWSPTFYEDLDQRFPDFAKHVLVSCHEFTEPWPSWEIHPHGDEVVMLLAGEATLVLRQADGGDTELVLRAAGEYAVVPRGTWHTARVARHARMLFITPGEGTENRAQP